MSLLVLLGHGVLTSLFRDMIMPLPSYRSSYQQISQPVPQPQKEIDIVESKEYTKDKLDMQHQCIVDLLLKILSEEYVLRAYRFNEYGQGCGYNYFKIQEKENGITVSLTVRDLETKESRIRHSMQWILYCLPYVQQTPVDFSAKYPYIPLQDGCGCIMF